VNFPFFGPISVFTENVIFLFDQRETASIMTTCKSTFRMWNK
jgi:hypothetical protein